MDFGDGAEGFAKDKGKVVVITVFLIEEVRVVTANLNGALSWKLRIDGFPGGDPTVPEDFTQWGGIIVVAEIFGPSWAELFDFWFDPEVVEVLDCAFEEEDVIVPAATAIVHRWMDTTLNTPAGNLEVEIKVLTCVGLFKGELVWVHRISWIVSSTS